MVLKKHYHLSDGEYLTLIGLSDTHTGSEQFNQEYFEYAIDIFEDIPDPRRFYSGGDLHESASKKVGNSAFKTTMPVEEQLDTNLNALEPFSDDWVCAVMGNHEIRLENEFDLNITKIFADRMKCDWGYQYIDNFTINKQPVRVYIRHGKGTSAYAHLAQGKAIRETSQIDADIFFEGHNHRLDFFTQPIRTSEGIGLKRKYYAFMGSFLKYNGYPDAMQLPILPESFQLITIDSNLIVRNEPYFIDQRRPDLFKLNKVKF